MITDNARQIVKSNFIIATFDAMNFDYFRDDYTKCERLMSKAMDAKIDKMQENALHTFAVAIVDGSEVGYDIEKEDFYLITK